MKKILVIHPYGNFNHNPNLYFIVRMFLEAGYSVDIICPKKSSIYQEAPMGNCRMIFIADADKDDSKVYIQASHNIKYDFVIGVDYGIIPASEIAEMNGIPYGLISYEITFCDEIGLENKIPEIDACKNISFAVCQDNIRSLLLSKENNISYEIILKIPVSGTYKTIRKKSDYFRKKFNIPSDKKIALYVGSLSSWGMIYELMDQIKNWPDHWVLVLHHRYGREKRISDYIRKAEKSSRIFFSDEPVKTVEEMDTLITSADLGLALYKYDPVNPLLGKNILFMGLASSKISDYLCRGVPVMVNEIGQMSDYIRKCNLGLVVRSIEDANPSYIDKYDAETISKNCVAFFRKRLDFNLFKNALLMTVQAAILGKKITIRQPVNDDYRVPDGTIGQIYRLYKDYSDLFYSSRTSTYSQSKKLIRSVYDFFKSS